MYLIFPIIGCYATSIHYLNQSGCPVFHSLNRAELDEDKYAYVLHHQNIIITT